MVIKFGMVALRWPSKKQMKTIMRRGWHCGQVCLRAWAVDECRPITH